MSIDISAINNVGEFYSTHYLDAILDKDVKSLVKSWEDAEGNGYIAPHKRLSAQAAKYFKLKSKLTHSVERHEQYIISHEVNVTLLEALGYEYQSNAYELSSEDGLIPVLCSLKKDGNPYLWIIDTYWDLAEDARLFDQKLLDVQKPKDTDAYQLQSETIENIPALIFKKDEPPRWLLILSAGRAVLIERHKWGQGQYLEFDLDEIMARKNVDNFKALAILLSREALLPDASNAIHDTLDENSHKHAYAVSSDLKYGIRRAVELLANEYVWYTKNKQQGKGLNRGGLDKQLTSETLTYMYRLLFLFYAEARSGDLGLLPMNSDEYRMGYSIESLRDLEQVKLNTEKAKSGYYLNESLEKLFKLINDGHTPTQLEFSASDTVEYAAAQTGVFGTGEVPQGRLKMSPGTSKKKADKQYTDYEFSIEALGSPLFDQAKTPLLSKAKYRNAVLQEIIQLLSLSKEGRGRKSGRGRISYAQLGINQLGAVYEGLLSYTGFFAKETLYEVKKADDKSEDENRQAYFIPESEIDKYNEDEFVRLKDSDNPTAAAKRVKYDKGIFIYRLAGRDREKSASYYTPEVLTKAVVKYSLKELLKDKKADEILKLTVCEPAMGSGAFLNEAVNQLADAYLREKQKELGRDIPPADYQEELQRVKAYIATRNCYGVDLNPTAVDLAKVSLWLNIIYKHSKTPWFNLRLSSGNSLIGARLQVFRTSDLKSKRSKDIGNYLDEVPLKVDLKVGRAEDEIYHFFVPDPGMAGFDKDKVIKGLLPDEVTRIKEWRKLFTKEFTDPQIQTLQRLSARVDELLTSHLDLRQRLLRETTDDIPVWPGKGKPVGSSIHVKEKLEQELYEGSSAYRKLKLVMDYWCSLWFWPMEKAHQLPTRDQYIRDCELILEGTTSGRGEISNQVGLAFRPVSQNEIAEAENIDEYGIDKIIGESIRLRIVSNISKSTLFVHWQLQFYEVFKKQSGFDLIIGNPPWVKVSWHKSHILSEFEPTIGLRGMSASEVDNIVVEILNTDERKETFFVDFVESTGLKDFLSASQNYPFVEGQKTNLYKCFLMQSWTLGGSSGIVGMIHEAELLSDSTGSLMKESYKRLYAFWHFINEYRLFSEVLHTKKYAVTISACAPKRELSFYSIVNLFHPHTIDQSFSNDGMGVTPGIKSLENQWEIRGHKNRIIWIHKNELSLINELLEEPDTELLDTRLVFIHSIEIMEVLKKLISSLCTVGSLKKISTTMFDENGAQREGYITENIGIPTSSDELVLSGPHFYLSNPQYQEVPVDYRNKQDYQIIDLDNIEKQHLQRTIYKLTKKAYSYREGITNYRSVRRRMAYPVAERTLTTAIIPPMTKHVNSINSVSFEDTETLVNFTGLSNTIVYDFLIKIVNKTNLTEDVINILPYKQKLNWRLKSRTLRLNCLTYAYASLWKTEYDYRFKEDSFCKQDDRLSGWKDLSAEWNWDTPFRNFFERRLALVELDVLVALELGISLNSLIAIYRIQFPILNKNERGTWYDQKGKIVFSVNTAYRPLNNKEALESWDGTSTEPINGLIPPFEVCDREKDMTKAYKYFAKIIEEEP
jgi:hypothetical protein